MRSRKCAGPMANRIRTSPNRFSVATATGERTNLRVPLRATQRSRVQAWGPQKRQPASRYRTQTTYQVAHTRKTDGALRRSSPPNPETQETQVEATERGIRRSSAKCRLFQSPTPSGDCDYRT